MHINGNKILPFEIPIPIGVLRLSSKELPIRTRKILSCLYSRKNNIQKTIIDAEHKN
jgi:hypothetical protein